MDRIVGYAYKADIFCPDHIIQQLPTGEGEAFDGWGLVGGVVMTPEANLNEIAGVFGIIREEESSFDSGYFPKVIYESQLDRDSLFGRDYCSVCLEDL